ncbi:MAG TPA: flagellar filament capping protein FliD [Clostridiaceae bacterium]|nr:flagellar filament capping protein FliD [Clostridiaceae bacterium]
MNISSIYNSAYSTKMRMFGLSGSGLDPDMLVSQLMQAERVPLDRLYQKRQLAEWRRDEYRNIINLLRGFKDEFFDILKPATYMLSQSAYKKFTCTSSDSAVVTATANADAVAGSHTIFVHEIATAAIKVSEEGITKPVAGTSAPDLDRVRGKSFSMSIDGVTKTIAVSDDITDMADLIEDIQKSIDAAFGKVNGESKVVVGLEDGKLSFISNTAKGVNKIIISSVPGETGDALNGLGFETAVSNRLNTWDTLETVAQKMKNGFTFNGEGKILLTINGKDFEFDKSETLSSMMSRINSNPDAGVIMQYDEISDTIKFTAKQPGAGVTIELEEEGSTFIASLNLSETAGRDAIVTIDGTQTVLRGSNTFTINGVTYNILKKSETEQTITIKQDTEAVLETIKKFVEKYNEVIKVINDKLAEKYDRKYPPLTAAQKKEMKEDEIKLWEEKAKTGLLRNDPLLENIVYGMRKALTDSIKGVPVNLSSIGITTGSYEEKGKLIIDEFKLREAIENNPDAVMDLFCKRPSVEDNINLTSEQREIRYNEGGLAYRLFDIIEDNIRTRRDNNNKKGLLLEKAGMAGDLSEIKNSIYEEIEGYNEEIRKLEMKLYERETSYYAKFAKLETLLSRMMTQSSYLMMQFMQG